MFHRVFLFVLSYFQFLTLRGAEPNADWRTYLGDAGATHYSALRDIDAKNVTMLEQAWEFRTGGVAANNRSQIQCNPLIVDGVLYGTTPELQLFAIDAATGRERWRFVPPLLSTGKRPPGLNRGLTFWREGSESRLFYTAGPYLHAIDPATGAAIASFGDDGRVDLTRDLDIEETERPGLFLGSNTPGAIYRDLIIMPTHVGEGPAPALPGHLRAYDVRTGRRRWIFHTIPHPGEYGYETWPADAWKRSGGANCWAGLTVDHERGLAFVPTGSPSFDFFGFFRKVSSFSRIETGDGTKPAVEGAGLATSVPASSLARGRPACLPDRRAPPMRLGRANARAVATL